MLRSSVWLSGCRAIGPGWRCDRVGGVLLPHNEEGCASGMDAVLSTINFMGVGKTNK